MNLYELNYVSLASVTIALVFSLCLPPVKHSIYFHRNQNKSAENNNESLDVTAAENSCNRVIEKSTNPESNTDCKLSQNNGEICSEMKSILFNNSEHELLADECIIDDDAASDCQKLTDGRARTLIIAHTVESKDMKTQAIMKKPTSIRKSSEKNAQASEGFRIDK